MTPTLDINAIIERTARAVAGRYRGYVEYEDLLSEAWTYILEHEDQVQEYREHEQPSLAAWWLGRDVWKKLDKFARKERAAYKGYEVNDEQFYAPAVILNMLPYVLAEDPFPPMRERPEVSSKNDPALGGDWIVMYHDVKAAWNAAPLSTRETFCIRSCIGDELPRAAVGDDLGVDYRTVDRCIQSGVRKLVEALGGPRP